MARGRGAGDGAHDRARQERPGRPGSGLHADPGTGGDSASYRGDRSFPATTTVPAGSGIASQGTGRSTSNGTGLRWSARTSVNGPARRTTEAAPYPFRAVVQEAASPAGSAPDRLSRPR